MCKGKEVYDYTLSLNIGVDISLNMFYMPVCDIWHHTVYFCVYFSSALYCVTAEFVTINGRLLFLCDEAVAVPLWGQRAGKSTCLRLHHSPDNIGSWAAAQQGSSTADCLNPFKPSGIKWLHFNCSGPYWFNPPFLVFRHSGTLALSPGCQCQNVKKLKEWVRPA